MSRPATHPDPPAGAVVGDLAEEELIALITAALAAATRPGQWPAGSVPPGDDAAVLPAPRGAVAVSTDAMGQGTDFLTTWPAGVRTRGHDAGWKAAAQNLSDVNAMGARASALVTALTLPAHTRVDWVVGFARGVAGAVVRLGAAGCRPAGGDLGTGDRIHAAVTVLGDPHPGGVLTRTPRVEDRGRLATEGADLVHVQSSSDPGAGPGWAAAGLALLLTGRDELHRRWDALAPGDRPGPRDLARAVRAQLRPRPPLEAGPAAVDAGLLTLMDVSDGLGRDAGRMAAACSRSCAAEAAEPAADSADGLRAWVDESWLAEAAAPLGPVAALVGARAEDWVLGGGEDYGLLGLAWPETALPDGFRRVGRFEPRAGRPPVGHRLLTPGTGWDHFGG